MTILKIVLAIFFPPVAAAMQVGISTHFWINVILTLLGMLPGVIHALWLVITKKSR
ncbi:MAG: YqaE/Pmp3 family membrane protein [Candidatus Krumholzibacteriia bacterium]